MDPPKSFLKSRENMQDLFNIGHKALIKYQAFDILLKQFWGDLKQKIGTKTTKFIFNPKSYYHISYQQGGLLNKEFILEFMDVLQKEYPGCDFEYKETAGYDGSIIEQVIVMNWN
jgi:hypothetical protein